MQKYENSKIILINHKETAAVADVVRQYFGNIQPQGMTFSIPSEEYFIISCSSSEILLPDLIRKLMRGKLTAAEKMKLPKTFELIITLQNNAGKRLWREESKPVDLRRNIRRLLHVALSEQTGHKFPWGTLSGVRPTQVALEILDKNRSRLKPELPAGLPYSSDEKKMALVELEEYWKVSQSKAKLLLETAEAEKQILQRVDPEAGDYIVYVGLPFCPTRCNYCSFITESAVSQAKFLEDYVAAVITEAKGIFQDIERPPRAVYFGGGTPTSLEENLFDYYINEVLAAIPDADGIECTMEAGRPDTITAAKLNSIKKAGFNKICINPQTMLDATLEAVGRRHSVADTVKAFEMSRQAGFNDINMDLIAGLPGDEKDGFLYSLQRVIELGPEAVTLHTLSVKRGAILDKDDKASNPFLPQIWLIRQMEEAQQMLRSAGYRPYYLYRQKTARSGLENSGFSKNRGSLYNVAMMSDEVTVIGLGSGATSKVICNNMADRIYNPKELKMYIERIKLIIEQKRKFLSRV
ncbi:MAG: coproporphyrinogen dehydrogenase HemZ [Fastidiosipila sp.]|nr:coproporphyrinogen dehydrogenase HemZ [Fastidiosipila sp.]